MVIDHQSGVPIYEQLLRQFKQLIVTGAIPADELIPSVRNLSVELAVNPNTVQKAYSELERLGITYAVPGKGRYVSRDAPAIIRRDYGSKLDEIGVLTKELALIGFKRLQIEEKIQQIFEEVLHDHRP